ncbi:GNAT family N-acetyltransferase [Pontibacterium sp.]|uniref:GNAT family N-acetyltransferase n=1 Tax=Pontibacterium sp. TaxID=2036026 RepID=UPI003515C866
MSQRYVIRPTTEADASGLSELLSDTPQEGSIQLNFEREPNYFFATDVGTTTRDLWVMEDTENGKIAGAFSMGFRDVFENGQRKSLRYGSDLRIHKDYQGGRTLLRFFKAVAGIIDQDYYQTVILEENKASLDTVGGNRLKLQPKYNPFRRHRTNMIELRRREKHTIGCHIRRATPSDVPMMQTFFDQNAPQKQFYPCYDFSRVGTGDSYYRDIRLEDFLLAFEGDELVGMTGFWDQKNFKQTRIAGYSKAIQYARPLYNLYTKIFGGLSLPAAGSLTSYVYLHCNVFKDNRSDVFADLLAFARKELRSSQYDALVVGFDAEDPLHKVTDKYKKEELFSLHFLSGYGDDPSPNLNPERLMYLETARL